MIDEMTKSETIHLQHTLNNAGYGPLVVDGVYGPATAAAYSRMLQLSDAGGRGTPLPTPAAAIPWWTSKAVVGGVITVAAGLAGVFGWSIDAGATTDAVTALITAVAGIVALVGTIRRKAPIDPTLVVPGYRFGYTQPDPNGRSMQRDAVQADCQSDTDSGTESPFCDQ